jgi:arsenate reductase-like glutaredoxin family protein
MGLQIFGRKKCQATRKAQRFFSERKVDFQFIDLEDKGISPGELRAVLRAVGPERIIDSEGKRYRDKGMAHMAFDLEEELCSDPGLLRCPIVRSGERAACGDSPGLWASFL